MKKSILAAIAAAIGLAASAAPDVTDVAAKQRYPWNGLVDIACKVSGVEADGGRFVVAAVMPETGEVRAVSSVQVVRDGVASGNLDVAADGDYCLVWNARADLGQVNFSNMVLRVTLKSLGHDKVQLWEGGPYWATTNIGAENPEDYGYYFWWGDTVGYKRENNAWVATDGSNSNFLFGSDPISQQTYDKSISTLQSEGWIVSTNGTYVLAPEHDAAQVQWGGGWRMPTYQELYDLCYNKCDWTWTTQNGVNGYIVRGRGDFAANSIFLPAAGDGYGSSLYDSGSYGGCWSSVPSSDSSGYYARSLYFSSGYHYTDDGSRYYGRSVRPVQGFAQ